MKYYEENQDFKSNDNKIIIHNTRKNNVYLPDSNDNNIITNKTDDDNIITNKTDDGNIITNKTDPLVSEMSNILKECAETPSNNCITILCKNNMKKFLPPIVTFSGAIYGFYELAKWNIDSTKIDGNTKAMLGGLSQYCLGISTAALILTIYKAMKAIGRSTTHYPRGQEHLVVGIEEENIDTVIYNGFALSLDGENLIKNESNNPDRIKNVYAPWLEKLDNRSYLVFNGKDREFFIIGRHQNAQKLREVCKKIKQTQHITENTPDVMRFSFDTPQGKALMTACQQAIAQSQDISKFCAVDKYKQAEIKDYINYCCTKFTQQKNKYNTNLSFRVLTTHDDKIVLKSNVDNTKSYVFDLKKNNVIKEDTQIDVEDIKNGDVVEEHNDNNNILDNIKTLNDTQIDVEDIKNCDVVEEHNNNNILDNIKTLENTQIDVEDIKNGDVVEEHNNKISNDSDYINSTERFNNKKKRIKNEKTNVYDKRKLCTIF